MKLLSDDYLELLRKKHAKKPWGGGGHSWVDFVRMRLRLLQLKNPVVLDYGCGRHTFKREMARQDSSVTVTEYDPGVPGYDDLPQRADYVVCTDVLEHVEEEFLPAVLRHLDKLARVEIFANIACEKSKSLLPDGRNAHITLHPPAWWIHTLQHAWPGRKIQVITKKTGRVDLVATSW